MSGSVKTLNHCSASHYYICLDLPCCQCLTVESDVETRCIWLLSYTTSITRPPSVPFVPQESHSQAGSSPQRTRKAVQFVQFNNVLDATDGFAAAAVCQVPFQSLAKFIASLDLPGRHSRRQE